MELSQHYFTWPLSQIDHFCCKITKNFNKRIIVNWNKYDACVIGMYLLF